MRLGFKFAMVLGLTLAILVPLMMIRGVIQERQGYRNEVVRDIASNVGGRQVIGGPVLVVPFEETERAEVAGDDGIVRTVVRRKQRQWTFFPETLLVDGELKPDIRKRGLHQVRVYQWQGFAQARFDVRIPDDSGATARRIGRPYLSYGIAALRGLPDTPVLQVGGVRMAVAQGIGHADGPGVHARLDAPAPGARLALDTRLTMRLHGTESFSMMPYAQDNALRLRSSWPHPKFDGLSPRKDIGDDGFRANWKIASVATNAQRRYQQEPSLAPEARLSAGARDSLERGMPWTQPGDSVSVTLIDPVNPYVQADRATKYGLLFVALTFIGFFMFELLKQLPVHPIQYLLVGLAIAIFFLLLVSMSEHLAFGWSYLAAACACIGLIAFYLSAVLRSALRGLGFGAMLAVLYAALYGLLLSEDNALALGAGLLFFVLAAVMVATRKVDWYQVAARSPASTVRQP